MPCLLCPRPRAASAPTCSARAERDYQVRSWHKGILADTSTPASRQGRASRSSVMWSSTYPGIALQVPSKLGSARAKADRRATDSSCAASAQGAHKNVRAISPCERPRSRKRHTHATARVRRRSGARAAECAGRSLQSLVACAARRRRYPGCTGPGSSVPWRRTAADFVVTHKRELLSTPHTVSPRAQCVCSRRLTPHLGPGCRP